ncbi:MAG: HAMP domain-containing histidine kinase [Proteobacteria bacterium]|nr:HAMP domain-containing histidine kinase [Pseudomonadota bacterium]
MIDSLLILSRLETEEAAKPEPIVLEHIAEEIVEQLAPLALKSGHRVSVTVVNPTEVTADPLAVQQILRNLVQNALLHTARGTRVVVTVGPRLRIAVEDDGQGWGTFNPASIAPFAVGRTSSGSGLGLSIVLRAAHVLGARVEWGCSLNGGVRIVIA